MPTQARDEHHPHPPKKGLSQSLGYRGGHKHTGRSIQRPSDDVVATWVLRAGFSRTGRLTNLSLLGSTTASRCRIQKLWLLCPPRLAASFSSHGVCNFPLTSYTCGLTMLGPQLTVFPRQPQDFRHLLIATPIRPCPNVEDIPTTIMIQALILFLVPQNAPSTLILNSGSEAQDKGDYRKHSLKDPLVYVTFETVDMYMGYVAPQGNSSNGQRGTSRDTVIPSVTEES